MVTVVFGLAYLGLFFCAVSGQNALEFNLVPVSRQIPRVMSVNTNRYDVHPFLHRPAQPTHPWNPVAQTGQQWTPVAQQAQPWYRAPHLSLMVQPHEGAYTIPGGQEQPQPVVPQEGAYTMAGGLGGIGGLIGKLPLIGQVLSSMGLGKSGNSQNKKKQKYNKEIDKENGLVMDLGEI